MPLHTPPSDLSHLSMSLSNLCLWYLCLSQSSHPVWIVSVSLSLHPCYCVSWGLVSGSLSIPVSLLLSSSDLLLFSFSCSPSTLCPTA
jgi:hypothetical protein